MSSLRAKWATGRGVVPVELLAGTALTAPKVRAAVRMKCTNDPTPIGPSRTSPTI